MGFFSDLKEDLSQAVNELMPDELTAEAAETMEMPATDEASETVTDSVSVQEKVLDDLPGELSLEEMLKNIEDIQVPEDMGFVETTDDAVEELAEMFPETEPSADVLSDVNLEEMLSAALSAIPDEADMTSVETEPVEGWLFKEPVEEFVQAPIEESVPVEETVSVAEAVQEAVMNEKEEDKGAENEMDSYASRQASDETAVITAGMQIKGDITSEGSVDVVGTVEGNIDVWGKLNVTGRINGNSKAAEVYAEGAKITGEIISEGAVKIGNSSVIIGNITAKSAAIAGAVKGDIDVQGPVILDASAIVMGNIKSKSVQINNGAVIEGMCSQCYADVSPLSFFDEYKAEIKNSKKANK